MRQQLWKPAILAMASLSLTALIPLTVCAQDRQDEHRDQQPQHRDDQSTQRDDQTRHDDQSTRHDDQSTRRDDPPRRDDHQGGDRGDQATQYRHDHPRASARCQDGFFTTTRDRGRACSKHGGIDVWIAL
jgi:hypothetical protein